MTLHSKVRAEFDIWDRNNKGKRCGGALKKAFIKDQLIPVYKDLRLDLPPNIDVFIQNNMRVFEPHKTKKGLKKHAIGSENALTGKRLKQNNTIINKNGTLSTTLSTAKKKQDQLRAQHALPVNRKGMD